MFFWKNERGPCQEKFENYSNRNKVFLAQIYCKAGVKNGPFYSSNKAQQSKQVDYKTVKQLVE